MEKGLQRLPKKVYWPGTESWHDFFPPTHLSLQEPNGLLALGGDLSAETLVNAYSKGIFPWFSDGQPILWWSPNPRTILYPKRLHISKRLARYVRKKNFSITVDTACAQVIESCSAPRKDQSGTWITRQMYQAYLNLHSLGYVHSIECWNGELLVGGLYGVALGRVFFAESMFHRANNASQIALVKLSEALTLWDYFVLDCQFLTPHLRRMGAEQISRNEFNTLITNLTDESPSKEAWT